MWLSRLLRTIRWRIRGYQPGRFTPAEWNRQYEQGQWRSLEDLSEVSHYSIISGYCSYLGAATILDVGCGQGILAKMLKAQPYRQYLGIDISSEAIFEAQSRFGDGRTHFTISDAKEFVPGELFDVIIFNECLYYLEEPDLLLLHYAQFLSPKGRMIVSICDNLRTRLIWSLLRRVTTTDETVTVINQTKSRWTIQILSPIGNEMSSRVFTPIQY